jgi:hypothetical protein
MRRAEKKRMRTRKEKMDGAQKKMRRGETAKKKMNGVRFTVDYLFSVQTKNRISKCTRIYKNWQFSRIGIQRKRK